LAPVIFEFLRFCPFSSAQYISKRGNRSVAPHATLLIERIRNSPAPSVE
jgi:hypothetical protein